RLLLLQRARGRRSGDGVGAGHRLSKRAHLLRGHADAVAPIESRTNPFLPSRPPPARCLLSRTLAVSHGYRAKEKQCPSVNGVAASVLSSWFVRSPSSGSIG